jgi:hypothetical protein
MKTILFLLAARNSGSRCVPPPCPYSVYPRTFGDIDNEVYVSVVVVVRTAWDFYISVRHADIFRVDFEIFWGCHYRELNGAVIAKGFVAPLPDGSDFLHSGNTCTKDEHLFRIARPIYRPLLAMRTYSE